MDVNPSKSSFLECNLLRKRTILLLLYCSHYRILHSNNQICEIVNLCICYVDFFFSSLSLSFVLSVFCLFLLLIFKLCYFPFDGVCSYIYVFLLNCLDIFFSKAVKNHFKRKNNLKQHTVG